MLKLLTHVYLELNQWIAQSSIVKGMSQLIIRADTSRMLGLGVPVTPIIWKIFVSSLLSGVIVTVAVAVVPGITCGRLLKPPGRAATVIPPISNTVSTPNNIASNIRVPLEVPPTPPPPGPPGALPLGGWPPLPLAALTSFRCC